jgi:hypothetical protein
VSCYCARHFCLPPPLVGVCWPIDFRTSTLTPTVCELERTSTECHPKRDSGRSFRPKAHPKRPESKSPPLLKQSSKPHTYPKHSTPTIHRVLRNNHRSQKTRGPSGTTNSPSGGARHEHLISKHYASTPTPTPNHQNPSGPATRF